MFEMEAPGQVPALWAKVAGDLSWLEESREQQGRIEDWVAMESTGSTEARDGLVELHPGGEKLLQPFLPTGQSRGVAALEEATEEADAGPAAVARIAAVAREQASALQVELEAQDFAALQQRLEGQRADALHDVEYAVEALKEVADPEEGKGMLDILAEAYGAGAAEDMDEEAQGAKFEEVIAERISVRESTSCENARSLLSAESPVDQLLKLSSPAGWSQEMAAQLGRCKECEAEAEKELAALEKLHQEESSLLSACDAERKAHIAQGDAKRKALKQSLQALKAADEDFRNWHLGNEILRKQSCLLKARAEKSGEAIKVARPALEAAKAACSSWSSCAEQEAEKLQQQRGEVAKTMLLEAQPLIAAVALNVQVALQISQFVHASKEEELQGLKQQQRLAEREAASAAKGRRSLIAQARRKDEQHAMQQKVGACESKLLELGDMVAEAQRKLESILGLAASGLDREQLLQQASALTETACYHLKGLFRAEEQPEEEPSAQSAALAVQSAQMQLMQAQMEAMQQQLEVRFLQMQADCQVRGRNEAGSTAAQAAPVQQKEARVEMQATAGMQAEAEPKGLVQQAIGQQQAAQEAAGSDPAATAALLHMLEKEVFVDDEAASQDQASTSRPSEPMEREESEASWEQADLANR